MHKIFLTGSAKDDLADIFSYIEKNDGRKNAEYVIDSITKNIRNLSEMPHRGTFPAELAALGMKSFREIYFKPYRIIYHADEQNVFIFLIADGRRDMRSLLEKRLLST